MIRTVNTEDIVKNIKEMCIEANHYLSKDMDKALKDATASEKSELGKKILNQLQENLKIADEEMIPICQDTGMAVIFLEVGQDVHFEGIISSCSNFFTYRFLYIILLHLQFNICLF